ncbi:type II secretion system protein [bacterium]|nr:type II secretion system protein [bacterium]
MKKFGFTLAEVLITLGIIGVVAALTAPALVMQSRNEANAAKLAVATSNLENAFTTAILSENVDNLYRTNMWLNGVSGGINKAAFVGNLKRYINVTDWRDSTVANYYTDGIHPMTSSGGIDTAAENTTLPADHFDDNNSIIIETKQGAIIVVRPYTNAGVDGIETTRATVTNLGGGLFERAASVMIDVNGTSAPNTFGRDMFFYILGSNGILYPFGGLDVAAYLTGEGADIWSGDGDLKCKDGALDTGLGCAGRVVAEGYKINY